VNKDLFSRIKEFQRASGAEQRCDKAQIIKLAYIDTLACIPVARKALEAA